VTGIVGRVEIIVQRSLLNNHEGAPKVSHHDSGPFRKRTAIVLAIIPMRSVGIRLAPDIGELFVERICLKIVHSARLQLRRLQPKVVPFGIASERFEQQARWTNDHRNGVHRELDAPRFASAATGSLYIQTATIGKE